MDSSASASVQVDSQFKGSLAYLNVDVYFFVVIILNQTVYTPIMRRILERLIRICFFY